MLDPAAMILGTFASDHSRCDDGWNYVVPRYTKKKVVEAGKLIASKSPNVTPELIEAFEIAHAWRGAHLRPMRRVRSELGHAARRVEPHPLVAARLKRLQSIRRKMQRRPMTLFQMQDIAGARAIMQDMVAVDRLVSRYRAGESRFEVQREWDYISDPKPGGYRSCHLRLVCASVDPDEAYAHLAVEVQIRSQLQHGWATAVEAVGLVRREELKSGIGDANWLRLFELMASEIAVIERRPTIPGTPESAVERIAELKDLAYKLDAVKTLENYNQAFRAAERIYIEPGSMYVIQYDCINQTVSVRTFSRFSTLYKDYFAEDVGKLGADTVAVEVGRVDELRAAYPNYFMDVRAFTDQLKRAVLPARTLVGGTPKPLAKREAKWADIAFLRDWVAGSTKR